MGLKHIAVLSATALVATLWPTFAKHHQVITFKKFLTIQTSKADPPRLAFDEINSEERRSKNDWDLLRSKSGGILMVGEGSASFASRSPVQGLRTRKVVLQTMSFSHAEVEKFHEDRQWVQELPVAAQQRLMEAQQKYGTLDEEWQTPSFQAQAARKIAEVRTKLDADEAPSKVIVQAYQEDGTPMAPQPKSDVVVRDPKSINLTGMIELRGLPPPTDPRWQIHVARYEDGTKLEDARVDLKKSTYSIQIPNMDGALVAELKDTVTGDVLGEGTLRLSEYSSSSQRKITIEKISNEVAVRFPNFYGSSSSLQAGLGRSKPVPTKVLFASLNIEGKTDTTGYYRFEQVQKSSWGLLRSQAKGFYGGLHLVQSGKDKSHPLFPESMIQALRQIVEDQSLTSEMPSNGSVVWGQVTQGQKALVGAQVQVEGMANVKPVYFNSLLLPDPEMNATGDNGYFAFVDVPAGFHAVVANYGTTNISHVNVVVDEETVSIAELESSIQTEKASIKVFDAFSGQPQTALLDMQSLPEALEVKGYAELNLPDISRLSLMKVTPQDPAYSETLQLYEDSMDSIHAPLVRTEWIQALMVTRKINLLPETGTVIGFVPSSDFEVYLGHEPNFTNENILYFDPQGQSVPHGVPGGGFVLFNVPNGVQSIVIANSKTDLLQTQVIPMDESALVTLKFR